MKKTEAIDLAATALEAAKIATENGLCYCAAGTDCIFHQLEYEALEIVKIKWETLEVHPNDGRIDNDNS